MVIPLVIVGAVAAGAIRGVMPNDHWLLMLPVLGTAVATFGLGILLNRKQVVGRDPWGNAVVASGDHSLYWIPVQWWSTIILIGGTILVFKN